MSDYIRPLAELIVRFGANVQPGQIVTVSSEPGKEELARAVAEVAYEAGALFVDVQVFDVYVKRARVLHAAPDTLGYVPPWFGARMLALGEHRCARIGLAGSVAPHALDGLDPELVGRDTFPHLAESGQVLADRTTNWTVAPCPTLDWAQLVHPGLEDEAALSELWREIAHVCRLDEPDPVAAWKARLEELAQVGGKLERLELDALHYEGPGTDLHVGLLPGSRWISGRLTTVDGIVHAANLPTEEVFTSPDPARTSGTVRSTKPLFAGGTTITGLRVRFERGRVVEVDADEGAGIFRALTERDEGAARLGEVALVDRQSRIGSLGTVFYDTLLDENSASHLAIGRGFTWAVDGPAQERTNVSAVHEDFMIGSNEVSVTGVRRDGSRVPLLRDGRWQI